jgi:alpha-amylase
MKCVPRVPDTFSFYYMCTKWFADGDVHKYFNPYPSPYDAYINFQNVLGDFETTLAG